MRRSILVLVVLLMTGFLMFGCHTMKPKDFDGQGSRLVPEEYFLGKTRGQGMFFDRFGNAKRSFSVDLEGTWDGKVLTLKEHLVYENGETLDRVYAIKKIDEHNYEASTADFVDTATIESWGNTMKWTYSLRQKIGDSIWVLNFDDWMHLQGDEIIINRAYAKKLGIHVGEVFMSVHKVK